LAQQAKVIGRKTWRQIPRKQIRIGSNQNKTAACGTLPHASPSRIKKRKYRNTKEERHHKVYESLEKQDQKIAHRS
jgi:hypothetical protein